MAGIKDGIFRAVFTDAITPEMRERVEAGIQKVINDEIDLTTMFATN